MNRRRRLCQLVSRRQWIKVFRRLEGWQTTPLAAAVGLVFREDTEVAAAVDTCGVDTKDLAIRVASTTVGISHSTTRTGDIRRTTCVVDGRQ